MLLIDIAEFRKGVLTAVLSLGVIRTPRAVLPPAFGNYTCGQPHPTAHFGKHSIEQPCGGWRAIDVLVVRTKDNGGAR